MPLKEPEIDNRKFEQILSELRLRIPRYTKAWTNFNDSDPGITLLQLFAWLSEQMLFRMNQVPLKNYIKFLKLLGEDLRPPRPATAHLTFVTKAGVTALPVPLRAQVSASVDDGGEPLIFETERGLDLISAPLQVVGLFNGSGFINVTSANENPGTTYKPFGASPDAGNAIYLGFAPAEPLPTTPQKFPQSMTFRVFLPAAATAGKPQQCEGASTPPIAPVTLIWEYRPRDREPWTRLNVLEDESAALTREGYVRVAGPQGILPSSELRLHDAPLFWIRVRLDSGRTYPAGRAPEIDFLRPNTVEAKNLSTVRGEVLGSSEGHPSEEFATFRKPVTDLTLHVEPPDGEVEKDWERVDDFLSSKAGDRHYRLNGAAGIVQFGDGERGDFPVAGSTILAVEYRFGGGKRGNSAGPGTINSPQTALVGVDKVTNERAASGGGDEQTLQEILLTGPALLRRRSRAVTPEDFKAIAEEIGGVKHAVAIPLFHPAHPNVSVAGALTVVVVPDHDDRPPKPSGELIAQVCEKLDEVRLLTTEVFVKGPEYQEIRVEARISAKPYASFDAVSLSILKAINKLLDPRERVFGDDLFPARVYSTILDVENVVGVFTLNIYVDGRLHPDLKPIKTPPDGLLFGGDHLITVEANRDES